MKTGADQLAAAAASHACARARTHTQTTHQDPEPPSAPGRWSVLLTGASLFLPVWDQRPRPRNMSRVSEMRKRTRVRAPH